MELNELLNGKKNCECGKDHVSTVKKIVIKDNALPDIPGVLTDLGMTGNLHLIADKNTYMIAGNTVEKLLDKSDKVSKTIFEDEHLITDMNAVDRALKELNEGTNAIIAVGSGTINDISRYVSYKSGIPYIIVATAPSMDGFASPVSPMMVDGFKVTYDAVPPVAIIGDLEILAAAPYNMILAGFGDIAGKYTGLADWNLGHLLTGEYYCPYIESLVRKSLEICVSTIDGLIIRDKKAIESLMHALVISGIAMLFAGNSRPASGAEHRLAHLWEMFFLEKGLHDTIPLHGENVGIASIIISEYYNRLPALLSDNLYDKGKRKNISEIESEIMRVYGKLGKSVMEENFGKDRIIVENGLLKSKKNEMIQISESVPQSSVLKGYLEKLGAYVNPEDIGIDNRMLKDGINYCMYMRNNVTVLRIYEALGVEIR